MPARSILTPTVLSQRSDLLEQQKRRIACTAINHFENAIAEDQDFPLLTSAGRCHFALGTVKVGALPPEEALTRAGRIAESR
jgi:hypothetical protein